MTQFFDIAGNWKPLSDSVGFNVTLSDSHPYFVDHQVRGWKILPGVVYLELALIAVSRLYPLFQPMKVEEVVWLRPIVCHTSNVDVQIQLKQINAIRIEFYVQYADEICGYGCICSHNDSNHSEVLATPLSVRKRIGMQTQDHFPRREIYQAFSDMGIVYGPYFQRISYVQRCANMALSWLSNYDGVFLGWSGLMDCSFQAGMAISIGEGNNSLMPFSLGRLLLHKPLPQYALGSAFVLTEKRSQFRTNITVFDEEYNPLLSVFDLGVKPSNLQ